MEPKARRPILVGRKVLNSAIVFLAIMLTVALVKPIPEIAIMLNDHAKALPASFVAMLKLSEFLRNYGWFILAASIPIGIYNWRKAGSLLGIKSVKVLATILVVQIAALALIVLTVLRPILEIGEI